MNQFTRNRAAAEAVLRQKCMDVGIAYEEAPPNESQKQQYVRRRRLNRKIMKGVKCQKQLPFVTDVRTFNIGHISDVGNCRIIDNRKDHHGYEQVPFLCLHSSDEE